MSECKICGTGCQWVFCGDCEKLIGNGIDEYDRTIADLTAKLKLAVEALEAIRDASTWAKSWDHPSHLNDKARVALAKIGEQR